MVGECLGVNYLKAWRWPYLLPGSHEGAVSARILHSIHTKDGNFLTIKRGGPVKGGPGSEFHDNQELVSPRLCRGSFNSLKSLVDGKAFEPPTPAV